MCVIAAYVGSREAAPTLIDMLRREQGLGGGFYTGIATIHEGRLHYEKALGDLDTLLAETPAAQLPGTIGIAHGRVIERSGDGALSRGSGSRRAGKTLLRTMREMNLACPLPSHLEVIAEGEGLRDQTELGTKATATDHHTAFIALLTTKRHTVGTNLIG